MANIHAKHVRHYSARQRDVSIERQLEDQFTHSSQMVGGLMAASATSPSEQFAQREQAVVLSQALMQLPADYREALILHRFEGLTMREAAKRMGRSVDSIQKLLTRGLLELRQLLGDQL
jgi:RNA polymerase sigma factor (sigma-70 family)